MHSSFGLKLMNNEAVSSTFTAEYEAEIKYAESKGNLTTVHDVHRFRRKIFPLWQNFKGLLRATAVVL